MFRSLPCFCIIGCLTAAACGQSFEDTLGLQTTRITLREAIQRVLEKSLDVRVEWLNWAVANQQSEAARGKFEPAFFLNSTYSESNLPQNALEYVQTGGGFIALTTPNLFRQSSLLSQSGFTGILPTGTQYKIFANAGEFRNDLNRHQPPAIFYPEYSAAVGITFLQPLLRDYGRSVQLAELHVSRRNQAVADFKWELQLQRVLAQVISDYFELIFAIENIQVKRDVVAFAQTLVVENQKRLGVGVLSAADVQEAEVAVAVAKEAVIAALSFAVERQINVKNQILDSLTEGAGMIFVPKDSLPMISPPTDRTKLVQTALKRRPDHRATLEEAEKQAIIVKYMRNQTLPRLDLQATFSANGLDKSYKSAFDRAGERQGYDAQVGFQFSVPLGNRTARANSLAAEFRQQQAILNIAKSELSMSVEIDVILAQLKAARARLDSTRESTQLAERLVEMERKRNEQGLSRSYDILKAQQTFADSRTRQLAALAEYNKAGLQLALSTGTLLDQYGIRLDRSGKQPQIVKKPAAGSAR